MPSFSKHCLPVGKYRQSSLCMVVWDQKEKKMTIQDKTVPNDLDNQWEKITVVPSSLKIFVKTLKILLCWL